MRIKKVIDIAQEVEIDVYLEDVFEHLRSLPAQIEHYWIIDAINTAHGILRRVSDDAIATMSTDRRLLIYNALQEQLKRYETVPVEPGEWKPASPFG